MCTNQISNLVAPDWAFIFYNWHIRVVVKIFHFNMLVKKWFPLARRRACFHISCYKSVNLHCNGCIDAYKRHKKIPQMQKMVKSFHDDVIKWKHFSRYWPFVRGIHRSRVNTPHKGLWRGASTLSLICAWTNGRANNRNTGRLRNNHSSRRHCIAFY